MAISESEKKLLLKLIAGDLAKSRLKRGVKLNYEESVALITYEIIDGASEGLSAERLIERGRSVLRKDQVMRGIAEQISELKVEAIFPDGAQLITVPSPISGN
ncbi:urease subunit gamma [Paenibacillus nanensis]|uniref:Urease subunit gamma n=1 Tax=Paenibacillus nanensis TaxID=393251 RepID=A0A3A1UTU6_9BACL|nr:urease subunit gamma [Paenibacillus nanensis]RIX50602.1 urease subunit gamma [Paenibacillus nanensis]